jgi:hypothetical protein
MTIMNYTTQVNAEKTIMEIEQILIKFGASGVFKEYKGQKVSGIMFFLVKDNQKIPFKIPMNIEKARSIVLKLVKDKKLAGKYLTEPLRSEQGERITFRVIKDWLHAQLSLMEIEFADPVEIFLPYAYNMVEDKTMYQKFLENKEKYLALEEEKR